MFYSVELYFHTHVIIEIKVYNSAVTGSESYFFIWMQRIYIIVVIGLGFAAFRMHFSGRRNWWVPAIPFALLILPFALQTTLVYEIRVNQTDIIVGEPIGVDIVLRNPTPFWVWNSGYRGLMVNAVPVGTPQKWTEAIGYSASSPLERGPVRPFEERVILRRQVTHNETGPLELRLVIGEGVVITNKTKTVEVALDPFVVDKVQVNPNGVELPFLRFSVSNQGVNDIVQLNVVVDNNIMPWGFGVDRDNHLAAGDSESFKVSTLWYDPTQEELVGFTPQHGFPYKVTVKAKYEDGVTRTRIIDIVADKHRYLTMLGADQVQVGDSSLLSTEDYTTLAFRVENGWTQDENLRLSRIDVYLNSSKIMDVDKKVSFGGELAVSSILEEPMETGGKYNMTIVAYSTSGEMTKSTEYLRCEPYIVQRVHILY